MVRGGEEEYNRFNQEIESMKNETINLDNYKIFVQKISSKQEIIRTIILNVENSYRQNDAKIEEYKEAQKKRNEVETAYVERKLYELEANGHSLQMEAYSWSWLIIELNNLSIEKMKNLLEDAGANQLHRDAIKASTVFIDKQNDMNIMLQKANMEVQTRFVDQKILAMDEKFLASLKMITKLYISSARSLEENMVKVFKELNLKIEDVKTLVSKPDEEDLKVITKKLAKSVDIEEIFNKSQQKEEVKETRNIPNQAFADEDENEDEDVFSSGEIDDEDMEDED